MNLLNLGRQHPRLRRELSRRIGYTNGLHDIFRFSRVVKYLHRIAPASGPALRSIILDEENVKGSKYADGVIEVAGALGLISKIGTKLTLSDRGYALYAVNRIDSPKKSERALLFNAILDSDGDATLNLLDLIANSTPSESLGPLLVERLLQIIQMREEWASAHISGKLARDLVLQDLSDAKHRLGQATSLDRKQRRSLPLYPDRDTMKLGPEQRRARFYDHTVQPRRGWLRDLACIQVNDGGQYETTESATQLLAFLRKFPYWKDDVFVLPFSTGVLELLEVADSKDADDLFWRATAYLFTDQPTSTHISSVEGFQLIKSVYPHVKLHVFNEATVESVYHTIAARLAILGKFVEQKQFHFLLDSICDEFPGKIYKLRERQGGTGYIAIKDNPGRQ